MSGCRSRADKYFPSGGISYQNETKANERLHLPDSSIVIVAPATTIELAKGFGKDNRQVSLDGEAWFEITKSPPGAGVGSVTPGSDTGRRFGSEAGRGMGPGAGRGPGLFELHTRDLMVAVLQPGRFHAEAFRSKPGEEIDLLDGGLKASKSYHSDSDNEPEVLGPGEMVMINRDIDLMEKEKLNAAEVEKLRGAW